MSTARSRSPLDCPNAISIPLVIEIRSLAPDDDATAFSQDAVGKRRSAAYLVSAEGGIPRKLIAGHDQGVFG